LEDLGRVSIILPTYNGSRFLRRSIDSCLNQTYGNFELIIVDDGSTDTTKEIIGSYNDERISYVRHEMNRGLSAALNTGFFKSSGKYLTWTSDDNYYSSNAIEKMITFLKERACDFVYCDYCRFREDSVSDPVIVKLIDNLDLREENSIGSCFLYSRQVMESVGQYDQEANLAEDYDYWLRASKHFIFCHMNEPLYYYREHDHPSSPRQLEVRIASLLVLVKNNIMDSQEATRRLIETIYWHSRLRRLGAVLLPYLSESIAKIFVKTIFAGRSERVLKEFETGKIDFKTARLTLIQITKGFGSG